MIDETGNTEGLDRIRTGNEQLDAILGGGFPANSINIIMGEPGSGKTILAERLIFENARTSPDGRPILYLTTLSEPLEKVVRYLQQFDFYDDEKLASGAIVYDTLGPELEANGISALVPKLKAIIKSLGPKIIVIDSFKAIHDLSTSVPDMRRMLYEVSGLLTAYDTTALLLGEYSESMISILPEFAVADGMLELARTKRSTRDERYLRVLKLRGSGYREGYHAFRIASSGLEVFPRLTSPAIPPTFDTTSDHRIGTGVAGLDALLGGGLPVGSTTILQGFTGCGKTTAGLQFVLEGVRAGAPALYVNFQENPSRLARTVHNLGTSMADARRDGLHLLYASPVELQIDTIIVELFTLVKVHGIKRIVIDAISDLFASGGDVARTVGYLYALGQNFQVCGATTVMTLETSDSNAAMLVGQVSAICDNIVSLAVDRRQDEARRLLSIIKARGTDHDLNAHPFEISARGLALR